MLGAWERVVRHELDVTLLGGSWPSKGISLTQNTTGDPVRKCQNRARALHRLWEFRSSKAHPTVQVRTA